MEFYIIYVSTVKTVKYLSMFKKYLICHKIANLGLKFEPQFEDGNMGDPIKVTTPKESEEKLRYGYSLQSGRGSWVRSWASWTAGAAAAVICPAFGCGSLRKAGTLRAGSGWRPARPRARTQTSVWWALACYQLSVITVGELASYQVITLVLSKAVRLSCTSCLRVERARTGGGRAEAGTTWPTRPVKPPLTPTDAAWYFEGFMCFRSFITCHLYFIRHETLQ